MKANELRIGNWIVLVKEDIKQTRDYQLDAYDIYKASEFGDITECLLPIPLTEEWLIKFGFEKRVIGYDYDYMNADIITSTMQVEDGRLVLPSGQSYRVMLLPDRVDISLEVLKKLGKQLRMVPFK